MIKVDEDRLTRSGAEPVVAAELDVRRFVELSEEAAQGLHHALGAVVQLVQASQVEVDVDHALGVRLYDLTDQPLDFHPTRQLRNAIEWVLIMAPGDANEPIHADMLPPDIGSIAPAGLRGDGEVMSLPLRAARELFEKRYLDAQVARFGGNISRTAAFVGMERSALHRKLRSLGIHTNERAGKPEG